jgi:hypothetical protein
MLYCKNNKSYFLSFLDVHRVHDFVNEDTETLDLIQVQSYNNDTKFITFLATYII